MNNRVFFSNNGALEDFSVALNRYSTGEEDLPFVADEDAIFIGSRLPFNHLYFELGVVNVNDTVMSVAYWDGDEWIDSVETIDETNGFKQSGFVSWVPNKDKGWTRESTNFNADQITGLTSVTVYDMYWMRIKFSADLEAAPPIDMEPQDIPSIQWVGNLFSDDLDLGDMFPDLVRSNVLTSFKAGKTSWQEQHVRAAEILIQDLVNSGAIMAGNQILNRENYRAASVQKTAEIIFRSFGTDYVEPADAARNEYKMRLASSRATVDKNLDGLEQVAERFNQQGFMRR